MITSAFLYLVYGFIIAILSPLFLLSDVTLDGAFNTAIASVSGYFSSLTAVVPTGTLITILGITLIYEFWYFTFKLVYWLIRRFPTQS